MVKRDCLIVALVIRLLSFDIIMILFYHCNNFVEIGTTSHQTENFNFQILLILFFNPFLIYILRIF